MLFAEYGDGGWGLLYGLLKYFSLSVNPTTRYPYNHGTNMCDLCTLYLSAVNNKTS